MDIWAATSLRRYWAVEGRLTFPELANKRLMVETWAAHRDYPEEDFFGIGPDSARENRTNYEIRVGSFRGARGSATFSDLCWRAAAFKHLLNPRLGQGKDT